ncbi:MAG: hypothetical protein Q9181_000738 [Wetmoreana brouardii]
MWKRKTPAEMLESTGKPRKRVAFSKPKNAATKALIGKNASDSPLLRLPIELRNKIWTEMLGARLIHVDYFCDGELKFKDNEDFCSRLKYSTTTFESYGSAWRHVVCQDDGPEDRPDAEVIIEGGHEQHDQAWSIRPHGLCDTDYEERDPALPFECYGHETMRLAILRTSRQVYVEANEVLFTTNTFSFKSPVALKRFVMTRNIHQKRLIRNLRMEMNWGAAFLDIDGWNSSLTMATIKSLSGLRSLRLHILHGSVPPLSRNEARRTKWPTATTYCEGLRKLSTLPIVQAEVVIKPDCGQFQFELWNARDMVEAAERVKAMLENPKGLEEYTEAQQVRKEALQRERVALERFKAGKPRGPIGQN